VSFSNYRLVEASPRVTNSAGVLLGSLSYHTVRIGTHTPDQGWGVVLIDLVTGPGPLQ
jgi:hypothetical protein